MDRTLALLVARWGADQLSSALLGEDLGGLAGDIASALLGTVEQMDADQRLLSRIGDGLHTLTEQRYDVAFSSASRYMTQSLLAGRASTARTLDLQRAEALLVEAAHAATSSMRRAQAERLLVLVRLATGDTVGAAHASQLLELAAGDAVAEVVSSPYDGTGYERMRLGADLLSDAIGADELVTGSAAAGRPSSVTLSLESRGVVLEVQQLGEFAFAGVRGTLAGITEGGPSDSYQVTRAVAGLSSARQVGGDAWLGLCDLARFPGHECAASPFEADPVHLSPGAEVVVEHGEWNPRDGGNTCLIVAGLCFTASLAPQLH